MLEGRPSAFWEHEAIANYYGDDHFKHPSCITQNILKTRVVQRKDGECTVAVTAHGYEGVTRVDHESVLGGDGAWHDVPVEWIEYLPVEQTSNMYLSEKAAPSDVFKNRAASSGGSAYRRSILSFLAKA